MPLERFFREGGREKSREPGDLPRTKVWLLGRGVPGGSRERARSRRPRHLIPRTTEGKSMSALGKHVLEGDFDTNGQVVVQTPLERVIERSVVVTRTVTEVPVKSIGPKPVAKAE